MKPPRSTCRILGVRSLPLRRALERGWDEGLRNGIVTYDPSAAECLEVPPFRFHLLASRSSRPGAKRDPRPPPEGIRLPHAPCPFDGETFVEEREIIRLSRGGRTYHVTCNRYPVTPLHFLVVRAYDSPEEVLPQCVHGPEEIEDIFLVLEMIGEPYRGYFNSNRGADDSQSGSSVNHWHFQLFPLPPEIPAPLLEGRADLAERGDGLRVGSVPSWPGRHLLLEGEREQAPRAAQVLWEAFRKLNERNVAYNLEVAQLPRSRFRAFLFPRHPGREIDVPGAGKLSPNFGGWELSGDVVIPTREIFDWIRRNPDDARRVTEDRLRETTRSPP